MKLSAESDLTRTQFYDLLQRRSSQHEIDSENGASESESEDDSESSKTEASDEQMPLLRHQPISSTSAVYLYELLIINYPFICTISHSVHLNYSVHLNHLKGIDI